MRACNAIHTCVFQEKRIKHNNNDYRYAWVWLTLILLLIQNWRRNKQLLKSIILYYLPVNICLSINADTGIIYENWEKFWTLYKIFKKDTMQWRISLFWRLFSEAEGLNSSARETIRISETEPSLLSLVDVSRWHLWNNWILSFVC